MDVLDISIIWGIFSSISILIIYTYLYMYAGYKFLKPWIAGWSLYLASQISVYMMMGSWADSSLLRAVRCLTLIIGSYLFLVGVHSLAGKNQNRYWLLSVKLVSIWVVLAEVKGLDQIATIIPVWTLTGSILIFIGILTKRYHGKAYLMGGYLKYAFIGWGVHRIIYIFLYKSIVLAPWIFFINIVFQYIVAIGVILFFFNHARKKLILSELMYDESESRYESLFERNHSVMLLVNPETGEIIEANNAACEYYGYSAKDLHSMNINEISMSSTEEIFNHMENAISNRKRTFYFEHRLSGGEIRNVEVYSGPIMLQGNTLLYSIVHDITDRKRAEDRIVKMAYYDELTGLPTEMLFIDRLNEALEKAGGSGRIVGMLLLDFDRFKNINNTLGHNVGDEFLKIVSARLRSLLGDDYFIARLGGDEFGVLLPNLQEKESALNIAGIIVSEFKVPTKLDNYELFSTVSIGISLSPPEEPNAEQLIRNASIAMYRTKELGRDNFKMFTQEMKKGVLDAFNLANNLGGAIEKNELMLHYQPKVDMSSGEISGVEALLRWNHPVLGCISPVDFIPIAEETGLIVPIGEWVLRTACLQAIKWNNEGLPGIKMAVNISGRQLHNPGFLEMVVDVLDETGIDPRSLELEITESIAVRNISSLNKMIKELKKLGISIAMDDFGTGYSALSSLNQINLDILKIDQSFIKSITRTPKGKEITESIILMAHALNLKVTAEGVETDEHMDFLRNQRCDFIQGYYISKPVPSEIMGEMLLKQFKLTSQEDDGSLYV